MPSGTPYDVTIAGAGPAGCAAALVLQQAGLRVCLIDEGLPDGPKVGESLPGAAHRLLHRLGIGGLVDLLPQSAYRPCVANLSAWGSQQWTYQDALTNPDGGGWHIDRAAFDGALLARAVRAGVGFRQARITDAKPHQEGYRTYLATPNGQPDDTLDARWLIDATGRRALVSRRLQVGRQKLSNQVAGVGWVVADPADCDHTTRIKSEADGWWYTALLPSASRVIGFYGLPATVAALCKNTAAFLRRFNEAVPLPQRVDEAQPVGLRTVDASLSRCVSVGLPGLICVGDAALSLDPLASQGIFFALYSGIVGAEAVLKSLSLPTQTAAALTTYQQQVDRVFEANQRTRLYLYATEAQYAAEPFWQSRLY